MPLGRIKNFLASSSVQTEGVVWGRLRPMRRSGSCPRLVDADS